jgi:hypothetical protein
VGFYGTGVLLAALHEGHGCPITLRVLACAHFPVLQARPGLAWRAAAAR